MVIPVDIGDGDLVLGVLFLLSGGVGSQWLVEPHLLCCSE